MTSRRNFLGTVAAVLAMPAIGQVVPAAPLGRGMTTSILHLDEAAFQPVMGKAGQVLTVGESGPEWRDPPAWAVLCYGNMNWVPENVLFARTTISNTL